MLLFSDVGCDLVELVIFAVLDPAGLVTLIVLGFALVVFVVVYVDDAFATVVVFEVVGAVLERAIEAARRSEMAIFIYKCILVFVATRVFHLMADSESE